MRKITQSYFFKSVATVASGTALAQLITLIFMPLITRLYGPEVYGLQGVFMNAVNVLATIGALAYPTAIVLPRKEKDAIDIAVLCIFIAIFTLIVTSAALYLWGDYILALLNASEISPLKQFIPLAAACAVGAVILDQWLVRKNEFKCIAKFKVVTVGITSLAKTGIGFISPSATSLILTSTVGSGLGLAITYAAWSQKKLPPDKATKKYRVNLERLKKLALQYRDFPMLRAPHALISMLSRVLPVFFLSAFFGAASAGQYALTYAVLVAPALLIGNSVMSVFYPRVTEAIRNEENARRLIIRAILAMAVVGAVPYLIIVLFGSTIFPFVFGEEWVRAGEYAQWLAVWLFMQLVVKPCVASIPPLKIQGGLLIYEIFSSGSKVLALWIGLVFFNDDIAAIALFSAFGVFAYIWLGWWVVSRSKNPPKLD
jgi:O-antigen/teichoic acid export membrane protein